MDFERPIILAAEPSSVSTATRQALRLVRRHVLLFLATVMLVLICGIGGIMVLRPSYTATATVAISTGSIDPLGTSAQQPVDRLEDDRPATEAAKLQSRDVAVAVLKQVPPVPVVPGFNLRTKICDLGIQSVCRRPAPPTTPEVQEQRAVDGFLSKLTVLPALHSRVLEVNVTADTGERAAQLANAVVSNYQRLALAKQRDDVNQVAQWLDGRTDQLRRRWLTAVHAADAYNVTKGLANSGDGSGGNPLIDRQIGETASNLTAAQGRLAAAQARADALQEARRTGNARALIALSQQPIMVATADRLTQLQSLRDQQAADLGQAHPQIRALDRQIAAMNARLVAETGSALTSISADLASARAEVRQLSGNLDTLRGVAGSESSPQAEYRTLSQEAQSERSIYETFLQHSYAVVDRAALLVPPVTFVSHAVAPNRPTFPNHLKLGLGVVVASLALGAAAVFLRENLSLAFGEVQSLRVAAQLPLLAAIPYASMSRKRPLREHVLENPFSPTAGAVRRLASQLSLLTAGSDQCHVVLIASAGAGEGKSMLAAWLALTVGYSGQKVLLIDSDSRRDAALQKGRSYDLGFTDLLTDHATLADVIRADDEMEMDVINSGSPMLHPLNQDHILKLRTSLAVLKRSYNLIIIDSPPLLAMSDGLIYASLAEHTVFVCRWQHTSRKAVTGCLDQLRQYGARIPGVVVSMVNQRADLTLGEDYSRQEIRLLSRNYGS